MSGQARAKLGLWGQQSDLSSGGNSDLTQYFAEVLRPNRAGVLLWVLLLTTSNCPQVGFGDKLSGLAWEALSYPDTSQGAFGCLGGL
jgi:hypothetical protein